ncbi:MAG: hypothetical protein A2020_07510 [Lentisphaerae bacterium GWF2_45_14]|nr:MAG: hypothetical protein A2020_07510 [Lentisphaerae bacterium GWF2_45_14]
MKIRKNFTMIDVLASIVIMMTLLSMLMPMLRGARQKAKYERWYAYNKHWSRDADCVINYDFQELVKRGDGDYLRNSAEGCDGKDYVGRDYDGHLMSDVTGTNHKFTKGLQNAGRWGRYKKALEFNGSDTYVGVAGQQSVNFSPRDDFTIIVSCKFDEFNLGDGLFSKSMWGTPSYNATQYDLYCDNPDVGGAFEIDVFTSCVGWDTSDVEFDKDAGWFTVAMRYKVKSVSIAADGTENIESESSVFVNGQALGTPRATNNSVAVGWEECSTQKKPLIFGAIGSMPFWGGGIIYHLTGKMDEAQVFKRAFSDLEIKGHAQMGAE